MCHLGVGLVVWNGISSAIGSAPNLFEHNHSQVHNTNLNPILCIGGMGFSAANFSSIIRISFIGFELFSA